MSTLYQSRKDVPTEVLAARLNELAHVVARKRDRIGDEFTMRIPAECDRDADLVMSEAARRLSAAPDVQGEPVAWISLMPGEDLARVTTIHPSSTFHPEGMIFEPLYTAPQPAPDVSAPVEALESLIKGYVRLLEAGMDRITSLGGDCDPVPVMEQNDPWLRDARDALAAHRKGGE